jgi:predicted extracellular nuclease
VNFSKAEVVVTKIIEFYLQYPVFNTVNTRTNIPPSVGGTLKIIGLNVLNYFKTLDASGNKTANGSPRGRMETEFNRQREKLITALKLMDADVLG